MQFKDLEAGLDLFFLVTRFILPADFQEYDPDDN